MNVQVCTHGRVCTCMRVYACVCVEVVKIIHKTPATFIFT